MSRGRLPAGARSAHDGDDGWARAWMPGGVARVLASVAAICSLACSGDARVAELEPRLGLSSVRAPHTIDFATASSGLADAAGHATGFSLLLPSARSATHVPARVRVDPPGHELVLAPSAGDTGLTSFGLPVLLSNGRARVETLLVEPPRGNGAGERAGLWFGVSDDNYIELALASTPEGLLLRAQMEEEGTTGAAITRRVQLPASSVRLALELLPGERVVRAYAAIGAAGAEELLGTFDAVPDAWFDRDRAGLMDGDPSPRGLVGLFASAGARPLELAALPYRFRGFEISTAGSGPELQPAFGRWQRGAASTLPVALGNAAAAELAGKVYVVGGSDASRAERALFIYEPDADAWKPGPSLPESFPPVASPAVVAHRGALVVIGGLMTGAGATAKVIALDPAAGVWSSLAPLPIPLGAATAQSIGGDLYVAGGLDGAVSHAELWVLHAGSSTWAPAAAMSSARHGAASTVIGERLYVFGGTREGGAALALAEVYDPASNEWTALAPLPAPVSFASATAARGRAVVLAGDSASATGSPTWLYDPGADTWSALPPAPRSRSGAAAARLGEAVMVLGGAALDGAVDVLRLE